MAAIIELAGLRLSFPGSARPILDALDLAIERGRFTAIVGASGAGKSTLLRVIAGLIPASAGTIRRNIEERPMSRATAIVFQDPRLMPWRTIAANVALGLEGLPLAREERDRRLSEALTLVRLQDYAERWPYQLSGGQRQRVGIARALAVSPDLLLMDEPFAALDAVTRMSLQDELLRIWHATGTTILFVTHDIEEAAYLADSMLLLGGAPARITEAYDITAMRPRRRGDAELAGLVQRVRSDLSDLLEEGGGI